MQNYWLISLIYISNSDDGNTYHPTNYKLKSTSLIITAVKYVNAIIINHSSLYDNTTDLTTRLTS